MVVVALLRVLCKHASPISCTRHNKFTSTVTTTTVRVCTCEFMYYDESAAVRDVCYYYYYYYYT